jgi:hypothetical protein
VAVAPPLKRFAWPLGAAVAFVFLVALALHGERPQPGMARFVAAGLMTRLAPDEAREVVIVTGGETWRFHRQTAWQQVEGPRPAPPEFAAHIDGALRLLRDSGPLRMMSPQEVARAAADEYGLEHGATEVTVRAQAGATFAIRFGARNPLGSGRYARIDGVDGVPILSAYVGDAWEQVVAGSPR